MTRWPELVAEELPDERKLIEMFERLHPCACDGEHVCDFHARFPHRCPGLGCAVCRWIEMHSEES